MNVVVKKISDFDKLEVITFLALEYENLVLELDPKLITSYSNEKKSMMLKLDEERLLSQMDNDSIIYAAYYDNELIGAGFLNSNGYLDSLYVKKEFRGKTVGTQLLRCLINDTKDLGLIRVNANVNAIHFYERFSFHKTDEHQCYSFVPMELERRQNGK